MKRSGFFPFFVWSCGLALLCLILTWQGPARADASVLRDSSVEVIDVAFEESSCGLYLTGKAEVRYFLQYVYDPKEGQHRQVRVMYKYDLQSADGTAYTGTSISHARINGRFPEFTSSVTYTSTSHLTLSSPGSGQEFKARSQHHWTYNANGEIKTDWYKSQWTCK